MKEAGIFITILREETKSGLEEVIKDVDKVRNWVLRAFHGGKAGRDAILILQQPL